LKISNHKLCQFIVKKYINSNINWPKEIKIAQTLIKTYKDYNFWNSLKELKLPSLAWFFTDDGKNFLKLNIKIQNLPVPDKKFYKIKTEKIGEDKKTCQKPKNLLEFVTYGKKA
jgi:hypothetical protein